MTPNPKARETSLSIAEAALEELLKRHRSEDAVDELEMQLDLREKFFLLVAHDLKTPLATARVCAEMIQGKAGNPDEVLILARRIATEVLRADRLIGDLLDANRIRAGLPIPIQKAPCDLAETVQKCIDEAAPLHRDTIVFDQPPAVRGNFDSAAIRRALENLISNARKYGAESAPITVSLRADEGRAWLSVRNEGNPLGPAEVGALFQWHRRAEGAHGAKPGWGLGLMLVKGIAEAHGGQVTVESSPQGGTVFTLVLPR
jgi:signal transduction histidine kinase